MKLTKIAIIGSNESIRQIFSKYAQPNVEIHFCDDWTMLLSDNYRLIFWIKNYKFNLENLPSFFQKNPFSNLIIIGESASPHEVAQAFRMGVKDYIFMPLEEEVILSVFERYLLSDNKKEKSSWWNIFSLFSKDEELIKTRIAPKVVKGTDKPNLQFQLFGNMRLFVGEKEVEVLSGKKVKSVLAFLLYNYPKPVHREKLMEKFWGDSTPSSARNCLNVTICSIRRNIAKIISGDDLIVFENECYGIRGDLVVERDVDFFETYWKKGQQIEMSQGMDAAMDTYHQAFAFYRNDFLEDLPYEEWTESVREHYREIWLYILDRLGHHFYEKEKFHLCENMCKKILSKDPCLENIHRRLMSCYLKMGMRAKAIRQFKKCKEVLKVELNTEPSKATFELIEMIKAA